MSKAQHTPSPWRYCAPTGAFGHEVIADQGLVCQTNHNPARQMQAKADAHLIAASPDLLCMLQRVLDEVCMSEEAMKHLAPLTLEQARKTITKAEGK